MSGWPPGEHHRERGEEDHVRLHEQPGAVDFEMAWVSLPDLGVRRDRQRLRTNLSSKRRRGTPRRERLNGQGVSKKPARLGY